MTTPGQLRTDGSILGTRVLRNEDPALLTVGGMYVDDQRLDGAVFVTHVRSTIAHARIRSIDTTDAAGASGVIAVFTAADLDREPAPPNMAMFNPAMTRTWIASDEVRFVGEIVATVVSETRDQGIDAAELVFVDYDPLPVVIDPEAALAGAPFANSTVDTNVVFGGPNPPPKDFFADCEVVVTERIVNQRLAPCPLETRAAASLWEDGHLTQWASTQNAHGTRDGLAARFGLDASQVRVIAPDVGGGFGAKNGQYPAELLVAWVARKLGRPARWFEHRTESMNDLGHGRGQVQYVTVGGDRDGKVKALHNRIVQDGGAYPEIGCVLPIFATQLGSGVYDIAKVHVEFTSVTTNTTPLVAYRGAGRPEAAAAAERMMDRFADEIGMDPAEVRRRNFVAPEQFPYTNATGTVYDTGEYAEALRRCLELAGYDDLLAEQARRRAVGDPNLMGIGLSSYVEITNPIKDGEYGSIELLPGGKAKVRTGASAHGQGHHTSFAMIASELTGIPFDHIEVVHGDTDDVPKGWGTGGSKSLQNGGTAVLEASNTLIAQARELAADLLEANIDDIVLDTARGAFHVVGTPARHQTWGELYEAAQAPGGEQLFAEETFQPENSTFPFGAHCAVVDIDSETGTVHLRDFFAVDDCGVMVAPLLVEGQVHGGIAQGVAQALWEEFRYDEDGNPLTANFADYSFPSAAEMPSFTRQPMETPTPMNALGAKGIGESGTIGSTPAVQNAVVDALSHLGITHLDMPCTPQRVWEALRA